MAYRPRTKLKLARKAAQQFAAEVDGNKPLAAQAGDRKVLTPPEFSYFEPWSVQFLEFSREGPRAASIEGIEDERADTIRKAVVTMPVGDVEVLSNAWQSVYYVARVASEKETGDQFRDKFVQSIVDDEAPFGAPSKLVFARPEPRAWTLECLDRSRLDAAVSALRDAAAVSVRVGSRGVRAELPTGSKGTAVLAAPRIAGWTCNGRPAENHLGLVAVPLDGRTTTVTCTFRPPGLVAGLGLGGAGLAGLALITVLPARAARRKAPSSRFSCTVSLGNSRRPSGTIAMPRSTISSVLRRVRSCAVPSMSATMRPALGRTSPMMHFIKVLLPLPLVPSSTTVSPPPTATETSSSTRTAP